MTKPSATAVKELREMSGLGMMECKKILEEAGGDLNKAKELVAKRGKDRAAKLAGRVGTEGVIETYIHHDGKLGVMVELNCNTDFVARGDEFRQLAKEIAVQIAARAPKVVRREELDQELVASIKAHHASEAGGNKPPEILEKIVEGKMRSWYEERVLLDQQWVKDESKTIQQLIEEKVATTKENITVARFARFQVGETAPAPTEEASE